MHIQVHEVQRIPIKVNVKKLTLKHIIIRMVYVKNKEVILNEPREK